MRAILTALEEGRLIELPDPDKRDSLTLLASLIEAVPGVRSNSQVVEHILAREEQASTYMGYGIACPHARTAEEGPLLAAIGWSPQGVAYDSADGSSVRLILLYYIPDAQRNAYLKEISALARVLQNNEKFRDVAQAADLNTVRLRLLDLVAVGMDSSGAEARARMIQIETRVTAAPSAPAAFDPKRVVPAWVIQSAKGHLLVLSSDEETVRWLEAQPELGKRLLRETSFSFNDWAIIVRQSSTYELSRQLHDCLVVKPDRTTSK